jgi:hypothetical protein
MSNHNKYDVSFVNEDDYDVFLRLSAADEIKAIWSCQEGSDPVDAALRFSQESSIPADPGSYNHYILVREPNGTLHKFEITLDVQRTVWRNGVWVK